ncbi:aspartic peptidase domain-containing protein [Spinellus fusiger]|nr:aspartic peptidase domain-containing protein [Spinellus fusiger]KAI7867452.1 aspartic peptidase domain-containing protein [Spinellus fusiger]
MHFTLLLISAAISTVIHGHLVRIPVERRWTIDDNLGIHTQELISDNGLFAGKLKIGTPAQEFTVLFDYNTPLTWVPSTKCYTDECRSYNRPLYDPSISQTAVSQNEKHSVKYGGDKCIDIDLYRDSVELAGIQFTDYTIGSAYSVSNIGTRVSSGYIGLGGFNEEGFIDWSTFGNDGIHQRNFTKRGHSKRYTNTINFSGGFGTSKIATPPRGRKRWEADTGLFILGGIDHSLYTGKMYYFSLPTSNYGPTRYWKVALNNLSIGNLYDLQLKPNTLGYVDSSSLFISGPAKTVAAIHATLDATYDSTTRSYVVDCDRLSSLPDLSFDLGNIRVSIPADVWSIRGGVGQPCTTMVRPNHGSDEWGLGESFLSNFYVSFDPIAKQIGLAIPKNPFSAATILIKDSSQSY